MSGFLYQDGQLHCDGVPVSQITGRHGTPCYIYSKNTLLDRLSNFTRAFSNFNPLICFSVKSLANLSILRLMAREGCGFDVVSGGELYRVIKAGGNPQKTVFAGVGKTKEEISFALDQNVYMFNVESESEMRCINDMAAEKGKEADVAIRVNPDVDARTHEKTTTGRKDNKFGIDIETAKKLAAATGVMPSVNLRGLHLHLGSPIYHTSPYVEGLQKAAELKLELENQGINIDTINLGGGYCTSYTGEKVLEPDEYAKTINGILSDMNAGLILEPGRHIAAPAGVLIVRTIYTKKTSQEKKFVITDGAMNDLLRPALYDAFHRIWPVFSDRGMPDVIRNDEDPKGFKTETVDVVGPVCESGDVFAQNRFLPSVEPDDQLAIFDTGAYGYTMSSNYNGRPRPSEILVSNGKPLLVSRRETYSDLVRREALTA